MPLDGFGLCLGCMSPLSANSRRCPSCGRATDADYDKAYIMPGTLLAGRYRVGCPSRENGEGVLYLGYDQEQKAIVWIWEYYPRNLCIREEHGGNLLPGENNGPQYKALLSDFLDLCKEIKYMSLSEPVVPLETVVQEHGTAYAVFRHLDIRPLEQYLEQKGGKLAAHEALELLTPLCNTLSNIHKRGMIHRGISPHTVYISNDAAKTLYLWDFALSATRTAGSELAAELFNGYSAPEQYSPTEWQGGWTDVYAVGALFYRTLSGVVPPKAIHIGPFRPLTPLDELTPDLPACVVRAVSEAMTLAPSDRTQTLSAFLLQLIERDVFSTAVYNAKKNPRKKEPDKPVRQSRSHTLRYVVAGMLLTVIVLIWGMWAMMKSYPQLFAVEAKVESSATSENPGIQQSKPPDETKGLPRFVGRFWANVREDAVFQKRYTFQVIENYNADHPAGVIYDQSPVEGTEVPDPSTVTLFVSKGPEIILMPEVVGKTQEQASDILFNLKLKFEIVSRYEANAEPGTVISTVPAAGVEFDPARQSVFLFVMPDQPVVSRPSAGNSSSSQESSRDDWESNWDNFFHE